MTQQDDRLLHRAREALDRDALQLDGETVKRLGEARRRALAAATRRSPAWRWGVPAGAVATAVLAVALVGPFSPLQRQNAAHALEDIELLAAKDAPEFYTDYEFYLWLEDQKRAG